MSPVNTPLLDRVRMPGDLRNFSLEQLRQLADELRAETIDAVSVTGGHLGSALGVVELTVAIHAAFDTPNSRVPPSVRCARAADCPDLPGAARASTTRSEPRIPPRRSRPGLGWRSRAT